jgi:4,5-DOPA dioxygenase extradiol
VPMLYIAGLAEAAATKLTTFAEGYAYGSLSMTCYGLDVACPARTNDAPAAHVPRDVPGDETNL